MEMKFSAEAEATVVLLANKLGISKAEVLQHALATYDYLVQKREEGFKLVVVDGYTRREVVIRPL